MAVRKRQLRSRRGFGSHPAIHLARKLGFETLRGLMPTERGTERRRAPFGTFELVPLDGPTGL